MTPPTIFKGRITPRGMLLILIVAAPVAIYISMFGWEISETHARWSEFGTFMAGVYSPIVGVFTLLVLRQQFKLQRRQAEQQVYESRLERAVGELSFFADRLEKHFEQDVSSTRSLEEIMTKHFQTDALEVLNSGEYRERAKSFDQQHPKIMPTWGAVCINVAYLSMLRDQTGELAYLSSMHKLTSMFSLKTCAVLDNYHYAVTRGELSTKYEFSTPLANR